APRRPFRLDPPDDVALVGIEAEQHRLAVHVADAAADEDAVARHGRPGVDVEAAEVPDLLARGGVQAEQAVVAGSAVDLAVGHDRAGFRVAGALVVPELLAAGGVEAVEPAVLVLVEPLADVELAVREERRREDLLHLAVVIEVPHLLAAGGVEAVELAVG